MSVKIDLNFSLRALEEEARDLGTTRLPHLLQLAQGYASGTGINQFDRCWSDADTANAAAKTYDVLGSLTSLVTGSAISMVDLCGIFIKNTSTTAGRVLQIGAGSNPITGLWGASGDLIRLGPGGLFVWWDPIDGIAPVAGTGDVLTLNPGGNTIPFEILLVGRTANGT